MMRVPTGQDLDAAAARVASEARPAEPPAPVEPDPIDAAAARVVDLDRRRSRAQLRASLYSSVLSDPEVAARAQSLGRQVGLPGEIVERNLPDVQRTARMAEIDRLLEGSPTVAKWIAEQDNAKIAHDDVENLTALDRALKFGAQLGQAAVGGVQGASAGVVGAVRSPFELAAPALDPLVGTILPANPLRATAEGLRRWQETIKAQADARLPQREGIIQSGIQSGVASLARNVVGLPLLFAGPGGAQAYLTGMVLPVFGEEFGEAREKGLSPLGATAYGLSQATVEYATERLPLSRLVGDLKAGTGFAKMLARQVALEIPGEQLATVLQDLNEWAALHPERTAADYLRERPSAAAQTLIATLIGVGGQVSIVRAADATIRRFLGEDARALRAERDAGMIEAINTLAAASRVRARSTETFETFVTQATEDGPVENVFIDAQALAQSGLTEQLARDVPSVAAQIAEASATGGTVQIPVTEYATRVAGQAYAQDLLEHLRTEPDGMSRAEAQAFLQSAGEQLQLELERNLAEAAVDGEFRASQDRVRDAVRDELVATGRMTPDVAEANATLVAARTAVRAAQLGMTPETFFERQRLRVQGEPVAGEAFDQRADEPEGRAPRPGQPGAADGQVGEGPAVAQPAGRDTGGERLAQDGGPASRARGTFTPGANIVSLLKNADLSTFLHEAGHYFFENDIALAGEILAQAQAEGRELTAGERQVVDDVAALLAWHGLQGDTVEARLATWANLDFEEKRAYHERTAESFERYLFEGKAPSIELSPYFGRFRAWLISVYRSLKDFLARNPAAGELSAEVRAVFDRMLASSEAIALAEQARSILPVFETAEQAGMTPEEFARYQALGTEATLEATADLQARSMRDLQWLRNARAKALRRLQKDAAELRRAEQIEARREVMSEPVYRAWQFLTARRTKRGETPPEPPSAELDGATVPLEAGRLDRGELEAMGLPPATLARIVDLKMSVKSGGMPADVVAELFGFTSGDHLVRALAEAMPPAEAIEALTDVRMLERHGDITNPDALERAADQAVHNATRARFIAAEQAALAKAAGERQVARDAARALARAIVSRLKVRDVRLGLYSSAGARAGRAADAARRAGDLARAAAEKRNQLIQHYATREAHDVRDEIERAVRYLRKFDREGTRKGLTPDYLDQIDALLERVELRSMSLAAIDKRASLAEWLTAQREAGFDPQIPPELEDGAYRRHYRDMTVEEFRGLVDTIRQIEHLGRLKNRLLTAADQREYEAIREEITASIVTHAGDRTADSRTPTTTMGRWFDGVRRFGAAHIKAAALARIFDGGADGGPFWEYIIRPANNAANQETEMRAEATRALSEILAPVFKLGRMGGKGQFFPSIGRSLNREARIAIALNTGNEGNLQRLLGGEGWNAAQIQPVLESLTAAEWQAVQAIWDHIESYRPLIAAKERRVHGKEPDWVEPTPITVRTADGTDLTLRGGYYPIKYDPVASQRAEEHADAEAARRQLQGAYTSSTTRRSFTKARAEEVTGRPLLYTLSGLYGGVNEVIHDLAWHEFLIDANRLMRSRSIEAAIRTHYGAHYKAQLKKWVEDIAAGEIAATNAGEAAASRLRQGISVAGLGFSTVSAAMQITGFTQTVVRVGYGWTGRGIAHYTRNPVRATREAAQMSDFMRDRVRTRFRELNELRGQVQDESATKRALAAGAYYMLTRVQLIVDTTSWWAGYEKAMVEGNDEARAIALADQIVIDSQGGGQLKDLSQIERGGPTLKLFTVFYSFMNTVFNLGLVSGRTERSKAKMAADMLMLFSVAPAITLLLKEALRPGDDWDLEELARDVAAEQISYLMGMFVFLREFAPVAKVVAGQPVFDYQGPAGVRMIPDLVAFLTQVSQGELDAAFARSAINLGGSALGLPSAQINRTVQGARALAEGDTDNPAALLFGYRK